MIFMSMVRRRWSSVSTAMAGKGLGWEGVFLRRNLPGALMDRLDEW